MENRLFQMALDHAGYESRPSAESVLDCFLDYVDSGCFGDLYISDTRDMIESGEITAETAALALLQV